MLPGLFPLLTEPIFRIKISRVVNKHVFSSPGAIPRHQMVLKKCFFLHHRTFLKCPWLKGGRMLLHWSITRLCCQSWGGPGRVTEPGFSLLLEEEQEFSSSAAHGWIFWDPQRGAGGFQTPNSCSVKPHGVPECPHILSDTGRDRGTVLLTHRGGLGHLLCQGSSCRRYFWYFTFQLAPSPILGHFQGWSSHSFSGHPSQGRIYSQNPKSLLALPSLCWNPSPFPHLFFGVLRCSNENQGLSHWKGNEVWGQISHASFLKKNKKKATKNPEFISSRKANVFVLTWHCFFKVSSANEIPQPWAVLGIRCWFLKYGDILLQIFKAASKWWMLGRVRGRKLPDSQKFCRNLACKADSKRLLLARGFLLLLWNSFSRRWANSAHFHHANLLILIFWA